MNIIQIRNRDINAANQAFAEFMDKTERFLNDKTKNNHSLYKKCSCFELENVALDALREVSSSTPFRKEEINLISGAKFPDIVAEHYYGVEVKSTKEDSWKSTGSSIVESTRIENIEKIYMLFGKLGGAYAEFLCRPYQDCLSNIAVTHSPRYLIDMELSKTNTPTIFAKMKTDYDDFRLLSEREKVNKLRQYYKEQVFESGRQQMPWWMGDETVSKPVLSLYSNLQIEEKNEIVTRMFILFPDEVLNSDYKRAALWMCTRYSVIMPNMRDLFSAGGKINQLDGIKFSSRMPQVLKRIYEDRKNIIALLKHPDTALLQDLAYCWTNKDLNKDLVESWVKKVNDGFKQHYEMNRLNVRMLFSDTL